MCVVRLDYLSNLCNTTLFGVSTECVWYNWFLYEICVVKLEPLRNLYGTTLLESLGELPVNRTRAYFTRHTHLRNFCTSQFFKRACLHCLMTGDTLVLDSEWHWIFDCTHFEELRFKLPVLDRAIRECRNYGDRGFATVDNLVSWLKKVQTQYCLGVSLGSFIRQAISVPES